MKDNCGVYLKAEEVEVKTFTCIKNEMYAYGTSKWGSQAGNGL